MAVKLFVIGPPGSGKSTVCRFIHKYVKERHGDWTVSHINDYVYLHKIFLAQTEPDHFTATSHGGFIVRKLEVYDRVLQAVERQVLSASAEKQKELLLIEFARDNYERAFEQFTPDFVADASFLYLHIDIEIGIQRIQERIGDPRSDDDYFVPEAIFERYKPGNSWQYISGGLREEYLLDEKNIQIIENNGQLADIEDKIRHFVDFILERKDVEITSAGLQRK